MNFQFILDKYYLLLKMIENKSNIEELEQWKRENIVNLLGAEIIDKIEKIKGTVEEYFINGQFKQLLLDNNLASKVNKVFDDELFLKYYKETSKYLDLLEESWLNNKERVTKWLKETIKVNLLQEQISVYISHPKLNTGKCVDQKYIFWGHYKGLDDINYNITYLCHENLHALLPNKDLMPPAMKLYYEKDEATSNQEQWDMLNSSIDNYYKIFEFEFDIIHTIIELISDNELYTILSGETKYNIGHNHKDYSLVKYKEFILPFWFEYLGLTQEEIKKRVPSYINDNKKKLTDDAKLNIENFIKYLISNEYLKVKFEVPEIVYKKIVEQKK